MSREPNDLSLIFTTIPWLEMLDSGEAKKLLANCHYNWFEFMERRIRRTFSLSKYLFEKISNLGFSEKDLYFPKQSYTASCVAGGEMYEQIRIARAVNGEIVLESESDDPEAYIGVSKSLDRVGRQLVTKSDWLFVEEQNEGKSRRLLKGVCCHVKCPSKLMQS